MLSLKSKMALVCAEEHLEAMFRADDARGDARLMIFTTRSYDDNDYDSAGKATSRPREVII